MKKHPKDRNIAITLTIIFLPAGLFYMGKWLLGVVSFVVGLISIVVLGWDALWLILLEYFMVLLHVDNLVHKWNAELEEDETETLENVTNDERNEEEA